MTFSDAFIQQVALLFLGALITGFGVPLVLRTIDSRKLRQQKEFEADLARQGKLLEAQSELLDQITKTVWAWRYLAKQVVYYGSNGDSARYAAASAKYEEAVWEHLDVFRTQTSKARRLVSETAYKRLDELYQYIVHDVDPKVSELAGRETINQAACSQLASRIRQEVSGRLDDALFELASELKLTSRTLKT